jgi:DNA-directed RNA polymerase specialized sigma24 family protein
VSNNNDAIVKAIREADSAALVPVLLDAARAILRRRNWAGGTDYQPSAMEARELVNETLTKIFEGDQSPEFDGDVRGAIVLAMTSVATAAAKKLRRTKLTEDVESLEPPPVESGDDEVLDAVRALVAGTGDVELEEYLILGVEECGPKREDIAEGLGWSPDKVSVVSKRLKRLIERNRLSIPRRRTKQ